MRDEMRIDRLLFLIRREWVEFPDIRLCQMLHNICAKYELGSGCDLFYVEDSALEKAFETEYEIKKMKGDKKYLDIKEALTLSKYIINKCTIDNCPITNLTLQKILYCIQLYFLKNKGACLFKDDIEAWIFGPVVPVVYYHFCGFGSMPLKVTYDECFVFNPDTLLIVDKIIEEKRKLKPWDLVKNIQSEGKAWDKTYNKGVGNKTVISKNEMKQNG
jgi:uncharacterized phage-associated protein